MGAIVLLGATLFVVVEAQSGVRRVPFFNPLPSWLDRLTPLLPCFCFAV